MGYFCAWNVSLCIMFLGAIHWIADFFLLNSYTTVLSILFLKDTGVDSSFHLLQIMLLNHACPCILVHSFMHVNRGTVTYTLFYNLFFHVVYRIIFNGCIVKWHCRIISPVPQWGRLHYFQNFSASCTDKHKRTYIHIHVPPYHCTRACP